MRLAIESLARSLVQSLHDLAPLFGVIAFFQLVVLGRSFPDLGEALLGVAAMVIGLTLFLRGLSTSVFPLGEALASRLAEKGSVVWLLVFAFALGFGSTFAEPALGAVVKAIVDSADLETGMGSDNVALALRAAVSAAVGIGVALGAMRIVLGWGAAWSVLAAYGIAIALALPAQTAHVGVAFDAGAAATSAINIPLITTLGVGLATVLKGRDPIRDGFGIVALASIMPTVALLLGVRILGFAPQ